MLNDAQRSSLRILMSLIEEKMRAIELRIAHPDEDALMFEVRDDFRSELSQAVRGKTAEVFCLIETLRDRLALPREIRPATIELRTGLSQLWVFLQEADSKRLGRFGDVHPALAPALDFSIERLARLMLEIEKLVSEHRRPMCVDGEGDATFPRASV
jgi:hypothetical protein